jgi:ankyrin repeat protein
LLEQTLDLLIDLGADINLQINGNHNGLTSICCDGTYERFEILFKYNSKYVNILEQYNKMTNYSHASKLPKYYINCNVTVDDLSPLILACKRSQCDERIVNILLLNGANPNYRKDWKSALAFAVINNNMPVIKRLLRCGISNYIISCALAIAVQEFHVVIPNVELIKLLLDYKASLTFIDSGLTTLMHAAASNSIFSREIIQLLLDAGADINFQHFDANGKTALMCARTYSSCELLLQYNANVNIACKNSYTALTYATISNNVNVMQLLIKSGADIDTLNCQTTPLIEAYKNLNAGCNVETIELLLELGANPNTVTISGHTFITTICNNKSNVLKIIHLLVPIVAMHGIGNISTLKYSNFLRKITDAGLTTDIDASTIDHTTCSLCKTAPPIFISRPCSHYKYCATCYFKDCKLTSCDVCGVEIIAYDKLFF